MTGPRKPGPRKGARQRAMRTIYNADAHEVISDPRHHKNHIMQRTVEEQAVYDVTNPEYIAKIIAEHQAHQVYQVYQAKEPHTQ